MTRIDEINQQLAEFSKNVDWRKGFTDQQWIDLIQYLEEKAYKSGYIDCLHNYAIYRDGVQYIGVLQRPLQEVIEEVKKSKIPIYY